MKILYENISSYRLGTASPHMVVLERDNELWNGSELKRISVKFPEYRIISHARNVKHNGRLSDFFVIQEVGSKRRFSLWAKYKGFGVRVGKGEYVLRKKA